MATETEFLHNEITRWGEDYVLDLVDRGYVPTSTTQGWKWVLERAETPYTSTSGENVWNTEMDFIGLR